MNRDREEQEESVKELKELLKLKNGKRRAAENRQRKRQSSSPRMPSTQPNSVNDCYTYADTRSYVIAVVVVES